MKAWDVRKSSFISFMEHFTRRLDCKRHFSESISAKVCVKVTQERALICEYPSLRSNVSCHETHLQCLA